jgi:hypothetical protein
MPISAQGESELGRRSLCCSSTASRSTPNPDMASTVNGRTADGDRFFC